MHQCVKILHWGTEEGDLDVADCMFLYMAVSGPLAYYMLFSVCFSPGRVL
jgi:hypothetical protein